jgi:hypothetical protein
MMVIGLKVRTKIPTGIFGSSNWPTLETALFGTDRIGGLMSRRFDGFDALGFSPATS